eukprot:CAMPEP_0177602566 /NCGR_PEP_ID=MMETSP0419_2-20121207/14944_1 /TAXON_ID=582737 /ORGANISM="Tetraselmis sp., Strain GSL018" /LENGTH=123 /DNA_ID=CAMNT_0019096073 /DNA_START=332 /DNA_END=704 /DNA_ORIENTATION=+
MELAGADWSEENSVSETVLPVDEIKQELKLGREHTKIVGREGNAIYDLRVSRHHATLCISEESPSALQLKVEGSQVFVRRRGLLEMQRFERGETSEVGATNISALSPFLATARAHNQVKFAAN